MTTYQAVELDNGMYAIHGLIGTQLVWVLMGPENIGYNSESDALEDLKNYISEVPDASANG